MEETPVHDAFGLSYASWLVTPRVVLEAMADAGQKRFVELFDDLNEIFDWEPECAMEIRFRDKGKFVKVPEHFNNYRHPDYEWVKKIKR